MRQDAWRSYLEMALGLTEASRKQATKAVKRAIGKGGATTEQLQGLAEELVRTSAANREAITKLVRAELDRALGRVGLAKAEDVEQLTARVHQLEAELSVARAAPTPVAVAEPFAAPNEAVVTPVTPDVPGAAEPAAPVAKAPVKKAVKKAVRPSTPDAPAPARKAPARKSAAAEAVLQPSDEPATGPAKKTARKAAKKAVGTP